MKRTTMKLFLGILFLVGVSNIASGQISVRPTENKSNIEIVQPYDSLSNFEFNYDVITKEYYSYEDAKRNIEPQLTQFVNQNIYFPELPKRKSSFDNEWRISDSMSKLRGKYYTIYSVEPQIEKSYKGSYKLEKIVFKIKDDKGKKTKWTTPYYSCDDALLVGYYDKLKSESVGKKFYYNGVVKGKRAHFINPDLTHKAMNTRNNQVIPLSYGEEWECTDIQLVDDDIVVQLYAVFQNTKGEEVLARVENIFKTTGEIDVTFFTCFMREDKYDAYKSDLTNRFGNENANAILKHRVSIGMTEEMCKESWGSPIEINSTHIDGKSLTQWVYDNSSFLYFDKNLNISSKLNV